MPDIYSDGDHVVFEFVVAIGLREEQPRRLVLRCTEDGDVFAAIHPYQKMP
jgi:hypothetical protein